MNAPERIASLPDIQSQPDTRDMPIDAVGIKGVRYPAVSASGGRGALLASACVRSQATW